MRYQQSWNSDDPHTEENQKNLEACIRRAIELGITHIETARGYGTSEEQLGKILPLLPRNEIVVQSKVGPDKDIDKFRANFEKSMSLLGVGYLDIFSFHGINDDETLELTKQCLDQALQWQKEGRIRHIGFSTHGPTRTILDAIRMGVFTHVNLHWYYIFQENWPAIEECVKRDMGVFIISPNDKGGLLYNPSERLKELTAPLHPIVFNDLFCLLRPEVHTLSCGVAKPQDFDLHMEAVSLLDRAHEIVPPIVARLDGELERVLGKDWMATWRDGLPEWNETPGEINIPVILRMRNLAKAFDMLDYGRMRYNMLGSGGNWFPGKKVENLEALDLAPSLKKSRHAAAIPALLAEAHALFEGEQKQRLQKDE
jgi:hypothetical protein